MLYWFLLYDEVTQLYAYIHPFGLELPSPHPSRSLSSLCSAVGSHQLAVSHVAERKCHAESLASSHLPLPPTPSVHVSVVCVSIPAWQIGSSVPFF